MGTVTRKFVTSSMPYAVPQGSLLGPISFICYIATLNDIIQGTSLSMLGYADDHAVYKSFLPMDESSALEGLTEVIKRIRNTMKYSFLKMNDSKTEIFIFGTHSQCNKSPQLVWRLVRHL